MPALHAALGWAALGLAALLSGVARAQGPSIPIEYCASVNTADMEPIFSTWQSEGRCFNNCTDMKMALAIVQGHDCWCSNLIPHRRDQKPLQQCQDPCPGYPTDYCGGDGVYGYIEVAGRSPTGTAPPGGAPTTKEPPSSSSEDHSTVTVTWSPSSSSTPSSSASSSSSSSSSPSSLSSSLPLSSPTDPTGPIVSTVTVGGTIRTVTATPGPTNDPALADTSGSGLQTGAIVGIVVGVVGGLAVLGAFLWLWFVKRRKQSDANGSRLGSSMGAGGSPGDMSEAPYAAAAGHVQGWESSKRRSHLMPVDPRLDPFAKGLYLGDQNRSRDSLTSLQDNQDYSRRVHDPPRVLRATNPDPDVDDDDDDD